MKLKWKITILLYVIFIPLLIYFFTTYEEPKKSSKTTKSIVSSYPKGDLNFYQSNNGYHLSLSEYEKVCKNTNGFTKGAITSANLFNSQAEKLYNNNGNIIDSSSVRWDNSSKKCFAEYKISGLLNGSNITTVVSGQVLSFFNNEKKFLVRNIKNY
tara:strand:+ start:90 stop:557 length:468 start_codon:yes stop_codon:yes gene_type:complete